MKTIPITIFAAVDSHGRWHAIGSESFEESIDLGSRRDVLINGPLSAWNCEELGDDGATVQIVSISVNLPIPVELHAFGRVAQKQLFDEVTP